MLFAAAQAVDNFARLIGAVGALTGVAALVLQSIPLVRDRRRVEVTATVGAMAQVGQPQVDIVSVTVHVKGQASSVEHLFVQWDDDPPEPGLSQTGDHLGFPVVPVRAGPPLPYTLVPGESRTWTIQVVANPDPSRQPRPYRCYVEARLGGGDRVRSDEVFISPFGLIPAVDGS